MPNDLQSKMENSFGVDFSDVNIHKDSEQAPSLGALAYTQGNDIHFAPGQYDPGSQKGQELLGHELSHVVQQREGRVKPDRQQNKADANVNTDEGLEKVADEQGKQAAQGKIADARGKDSGVQRQEGDDGSIPNKDTSFQYPKLDQELLNNINRQNEIIFAEKQKIYAIIIDDIVNLINNDDYAITEVGYIEPNSEEYNIIWEEIYKNVKIDISLMPVKTDILKDTGHNFKISDIDIKYHNLSLKEYKIETIKNIGEEVGSIIFSWGKDIFDILKGKGPKIFGSKIVGLSSLFLNFFLISKEAGKGSSLSKRKKDKLNNLRKLTNKLLDLYIPVFFESI